MLYQNLAILASAALCIAAGGYVWARWRRAPSAFKAILLVGATYFVAGALAGSWAMRGLLHWRGTPQEPVAQPSPLSLLPPSDERGYACGSERWPVKTLSDLDAEKVNISPVHKTVTELLQIQRPLNAVFSQDHRLSPVELATYAVRALAVKFKGEEDHDWHVIIVDPSDFSKSMVTEVVDPGCDGASRSRARGLFKQATDSLDRLYPGQMSPALVIKGQPYDMATSLGFWSTWVTDDNRVIAGPKRATPPPELLRYATVQITGVGFWDDEHGVEGAAPNNIELHPVLDIRRVP